MTDDLSEDMAELADAAMSFAVRREVDERLVRLYADPFDGEARGQLASYLASERYLAGTAAAARVRAAQMRAEAGRAARIGGAA